jgi:hypothetical protein
MFFKQSAFRAAKLRKNIKVAAKPLVNRTKEKTVSPMLGQNYPAEDGADS